MGEKNLLELSDILEKQAEQVKDAERMVEMLGLGLEALGEDNCEYVVSSMKGVKSYLENIHQELIRGLGEVKRLVEVTGDE